MPDDAKPVRKCICFDTTFATLKAIGMKSVEEIAKHYGCGTKCGTCKPYLAKMIETGEVEFDVID